MLANASARIPASLSRDFFRLRNLFTMDDLINARVHLAHKERMLNPYMRPYIYGKRLGVHIFDLEQTAKQLNYALNITADIAYRKGIILFINRSRQTGRLVEKAALECQEYAYCRKWSNQVFTNSHKLFGTVTRLPDLVIFFSTLNNMNEDHRAINMSAKMLIPTIGICDSNSDPCLITYPIPGNDDSPQAIELYCKLFKSAVLNGKSKREEVISQHGQDYYQKTLDEL